MSDWNTERFVERYYILMFIPFSGNLINFSQVMAVDLQGYGSCKLLHSASFLSRGGEGREVCP